MSGQSLIVVMGVAGAGKTTIGLTLAEYLSTDFVDADALHPQSNVDKMASGIPLDDSDRWPWLDEVGRRLQSAPEAGLVVACSALKRSYRDRLRSAVPSLAFVHLDGARDLLAKRMRRRPGHFMPITLLDSQLATLEPLEPDEAGVSIDISGSETSVVDAALTGLRERGGVLS